MSHVKLIIALCLVSLPLSGCSTIKGAGEDLTVVGGWISRSSDHVKEQINSNPPRPRKATTYDDVYSPEHYEEYEDYQGYEGSGITEPNAGNWIEGNSPNLKTDFLIDMSEE